MLTLNIWEFIIQFLLLLIVYQQDFKSIFVRYVTFTQQEYHSNRTKLCNFSTSVGVLQF